MWAVSGNDIGSHWEGRLQRRGLARALLGGDHRVGTLMTLNWATLANATKVCMCLLFCVMTVAVEADRAGGCVCVAAAVCLCVCMRARVSEI